MKGFAVVDVETTGLHASDRVVEIGLVLCRADGTVEDEWTTLINPQRDIGARHIHGIAARDVLSAPRFVDVADWVLQLLVGRVIVAHNASFDMRFIRTELERAGRVLPPTPPPTLCTLRWARNMRWPGKLEQCCAALGVPLLDAHNALADARATAGLLSVLLRTAGADPRWQAELQEAGSYPWPSGTTMSPPVQGLRTAPPPSWAWIDEVVSAVPIPAEPADEAQYLILLQTALLDLHISRAETGGLADAARDAGLSGARIMGLHRRYLDAMADEALADDVLTADEEQALRQAALVLGLGPSNVAEALASASSRRAERGAADITRQAGDQAGTLFPGDRVVFTGDMQRPREEWVSDITVAGLSSGGVTKATRLVVAADPDSMSGKAAKARRYGIPVVTEQGFERLFAAYLTAQNLPGSAIMETQG